jgi:hypothetical protein
MCFCNTEDESFIHVWRCRNRTKVINQLRRFYFENLLEEINEHLKTVDKKVLSNLDQIFLIDDIFIPLSFPKFINNNK